MSKVSENVKRLREKRGLTQEQLADIMGKEKSTVSKWEIGKNKMIVGDMEMLCAALDCSPNELLGYKSQSQLDGEVPEIVADEITPVLKKIEAEVATMTPAELKRYLKLANCVKDEE